MILILLILYFPVYLYGLCAEFRFKVQPLQPFHVFNSHNRYVYERIIILYAKHNHKHFANIMC